MIETLTALCTFLLLSAISLFLVLTILLLLSVAFEVLLGYIQSLRGRKK
jgi:hypothetical protein